MSPTQADQHAAQYRVPVAQADNIHSHCISSVRTLTDGPQVQAGPGLVQDIPGQGNEEIHHVYQNILVKEGRADHRDFCQDRQCHFMEARPYLSHQRHPVRAQPLPQETGQACAKDGQGQSGDSLVSAQGDGQKGVYQCKQSPHHHAGGHAQPRAIAMKSGRESGDRAHNHHALDTQVEDSGSLRDDLADGGIHQRGACSDSNGQDGCKEGDLHWVTLPSRTWKWMGRIVPGAAGSW